MRTQPKLSWAAGGGLLPSSAPAAPDNDNETTSNLLARLKALVAARDGTATRFTTRRYGRDIATPWQLGVDAIDAHLPAIGLARDGLHDVAPTAYGDFPAAAGFALALMLRRLTDKTETRPVLWCRLASEVHEYGRPYGHGLETLGLPRARFLTITLKKPVALFWTMEEALKSGAVAVVLGDASSRHSDLTITRRLQLAAHAGKSAGLLIFNKVHEGATASMTRWRVATARSASPRFDSAAPGAPTWTVSLTRARSGRPGQWLLNWHNNHDFPYATSPHHFHLVPGISGGASLSRAPETAEARSA
jgi:protein ImuA